MLVAGVIGDEVHRHAHSAVVCLGDEFVEVLEIAEEGVDVAWVGHVVTVIGHGGAHDRAQPEGVDPEEFEISEFVDDPGEIADTVSVEVGEGSR